MSWVNEDFGMGFRFSTSGIVEEGAGAQAIHPCAAASLGIVGSEIEH